MGLESWGRNHQELPSSRVSPDSFLLGAEINERLAFTPNLSVTSKAITLESHSHLFPGCPTFDEFNSHLGTIWRLECCQSDSGKLLSSERSHWKSRFFYSVFWSRFTIKLKSTFEYHVLEKQQFHCCPLEHRMKTSSYGVACSSQCSDNAKHPSGLWNPLVLDPV